MIQFLGHIQRTNQLNKQKFRKIFGTYETRKRKKHSLMNSDVRLFQNTCSRRNVEWR